MLLKENLNTFNSYDHTMHISRKNVVNMCLEDCLRCIYGENSNEWSFWLLLEQWWFSAHYQTTVSVKTYGAAYNQPPLVHMSYLLRNQFLKPLLDHYKKRIDDHFSKPNLFKAI